MNNIEPLVSVVIPTYGRPQLVRRAIASALNQTLQSIEVIVVINGETDGLTKSALADISDRRLRIIELPVNLGNPAPARNAGAEAARAKWVAQLDDDDEWLPTKLERQYAIATASRHRFPIVSCYLRAESAAGIAIYPRRTPAADEHISDYLFVRNSGFQGEGLIQSSTIFTAKELIQRAPFSVKAKHDEWDWLLRACLVNGAGVEFAPEALAVWHLNSQPTSLSRTHDWRQMLTWFQAQRHLVTRRAYSSFLLIEISAHAAAQGDWAAMGLLLREAIRYGKPRLIDFGFFLGMWFISPGLRSWLRHLVLRKDNAQTA
jgi:glycosyltransferase involved in cell wall biosynthesis